jgi:hypothetical protein
MTKKERDTGELDTQLAIQDTLLTLRVLNKFNRYAMIEEKIIKTQAHLNDLWMSGDNKYIHDIHGKQH